MGSLQIVTHHKKNGGAEMPHPQQEIEMKIKITSDKNPWANGSPCAKGQEIELDDETGKILVEAGMALEIGASKPKRARNAKGHLKADDPSTPDVNEAWEGGVSSKKDVEGQS